MSNVYVLYNSGKLRAVYDRKALAELDRARLISKGYKEARVQEVQLQSVAREATPLDAETIEALRDCVAKS
jgi:hypothetical protein